MFIITLSHINIILKSLKIRKCAILIYNFNAYGNKNVLHILAPLTWVFDFPQCPKFIGTHCTF